MAAAIFKRAAAAGLIVTERQAFAGTAHQSLRSTTGRLLTKSTPSSNPQGSGGDSVPVTCGLKPSLPPSPHLMSENQVMLFSCCSCCPPGSARLQEHLPEGFGLSGGRQTDTRLLSLIKAELPQRGSPDSRQVIYRSGATQWKLRLLTGFLNFFFSFLSPRLLLCFAVTMVLFLVGISVAVNNSSHDNQTAGK